MEEIKASDGSTIAIIIRKDFSKEGMNFFSAKYFPLQVGVNSYKKGHVIKGHLHQKRQLTINSVQEVIYLKSGKASIKLYDQNKQFIKSVTMLAGDLVFFADGGHGFEMAEDTTVIEVKQGPYFGVGKDKEPIE